MKIFLFWCSFDLTPQLTQLTTVLTFRSLEHTLLCNWRIPKLITFNLNLGIYPPAPVNRFNPSRSLAIRFNPYFLPTGSSGFPETQSRDFIWTPFGVHFSTISLPFPICS
ncbi:hypothetical protein VNO77_39471 [Canavalia gladiata]|uniref:Uncharacterized protein n=1 Tax=Canavalia gladiata TaxID=3824 RepID=A0AAN9KDQ9_CANGL